MNIFDEIRIKTYNLDATDSDIKTCLQLDYNDLVDLRNRLSNDTHNEIHKEDQLTLDHVLDYLEILLKIVDKKYQLRYMNMLSKKHNHSLEDLD